MTIITRLYATLLRFPCASLGLLWVAVSFPAMVAAKDSSVLLEKSLIIGIIGLFLFIFLQLVAENRLFRRSTGILLQCLGWPLLYLLWLSYPPLPFEHWYTSLYFRYISLVLVIFFAIPLISYLFRHEDTQVWQFTRQSAAGLFKSILLGIFIFVPVLIASLFFELKLEISLALSIFFAVINGGFYFLGKLPQMTNLPLYFEHGYPRLSLFVRGLLFLLLCCQIWITVHMAGEFIQGENIDPDLAIIGLFLIFAGFILYWTALPFNYGWLRKIFRIYFLLGLPVLLCNFFLIFQAFDELGFSISYYLLLIAAICLSAASLYIILHRHSPINFVLKTAFAGIIFVSLGPQSAINISEYQLRKDLMSLYNQVKNDLGRARIPDYDNSSQQSKALRTMQLLDVHHGYSCLQEKAKKNSAQTAWMALRCQGYDVLELLQTIPANLGKYLVMLYSFDKCRSAWAAKKIESMGETAVPAIPHLIELLDKARFSSAAHLLQMGNNFCSPGNAAKRALLQMAKPAQPYLVYAYGHRNKNIAREIFYILKSEKTGYGRAVLAAMLKDPKTRIRLRTAEFLRTASCGKDNCWAGELLVQALKDPNSKVRSMAASSLARMVYPPAADPLLRSLLDSQSRVKIEACFALARLKSLRAIGPLVQLLDSPDKKVQAAATRALQQISGENFHSNLDSWQNWWQEFGHFSLQSLEPLQLRTETDQSVIPDLKPKFSRD